MKPTIDARLRRIEARRATHQPTYRAIYLMRWLESADEAMARAATQGITHVGLLLPQGDDVPLAEWEAMAREHSERIATASNGATLPAR